MTLTGTQPATALSALKFHLNQWFYQPDVEALEITLSVAASHYVAGDPVWLFVVGPPATGKTSVNIQSLLRAPHAYLVGDLTPQTLLSGKRKRGTTELSLLQRLGTSGLLLMKDFTTIMSKRPDDRAMIISQLREVYDGTFTKDTGESGRLFWTGKITIVAATTPAIEREWMILRDLGERFMTVRWEREPGMRSARRSLLQHGKERDIAARTSVLGAELLAEIPKERPDVPESMIERCLGLGELVAITRNRVVRDSHGSRDIIDLPPAEGSHRIVKALMIVLKNYAAIQHREPKREDMRLAVRLATNSIPSARFRILSHIPCDTSVRQCDLEHMTKMTNASVCWQLDELQALGLIKRCDTGNQVCYEMTPDLREVWAIAFPSMT